MIRFSVIAPCLLPAFLFFGGCDGALPSNELSERALTDSEKGFKLDTTSMERFRYSTRPAAHQDDHDGEPHDEDSHSESPASRLTYVTPEGWTLKANVPMRDLSFTFGEAGEGECYIARLPGAGGGLAANVNRWRAQMGAQPLSEEEISNLPTRALFGQPAHFVSVDGTFSPGMGSTDTFSDYRLIGLILSSEAGALFVKMTGPISLIEANGAAFDQFVESLNVKLP